MAHRRDVQGRTEPWPAAGGFPPCACPAVHLDCSPRPSPSSILPWTRPALEQRHTVHAASLSSAGSTHGTICGQDDSSAARKMWLWCNRSRCAVVACAYAFADRFTLQNGHIKRLKRVLLRICCVLFRARRIAFRGVRTERVWWCALQVGDWGGGRRPVSYRLASSFYALLLLFVSSAFPCDAVLVKRSRKQRQETVLAYLRVSVSVCTRTGRKAKR